MGATKLLSSEPIIGREYRSVVLWDGHEVEVEGDRPCDPAPCLLDVMHHRGDDGSHWCPTGFLWCSWCCGLAHEPGASRCTRWGE